MMRRVTTRWRDGKGPYEGRIAAQYMERVPSEEEQAELDDKRLLARYRDEFAEKQLRLDWEQFENIADAACDAEGGEG